MKRKTTKDSSYAPTEGPSPDVDDLKVKFKDRKCYMDVEGDVSKSSPHNYPGLAEFPSAEEYVAEYLEVGELFQRLDSGFKDLFRCTEEKLAIHETLCDACPHAKKKHCI